MESVQLYFDLIKAGLKRFAEYRSSFIAGFFGIIMINGSSILLIWVMLKNFHTLNEWTFWQIVFNYCLFLSCLGFHNTFFRHISDLENHIVNGTFDRFLLRPVSPLLQLASEKISITDWSFICGKNVTYPNYSWFYVWIYSLNYKWSVCIYRNSFFSKLYIFLDHEIKIYFI